VAYCLLKPLADKFKTALSKGDINPAQLSEMTSKERREFFSKIIGERDAADINALFESKLLLKNQQLGMINWAKKVTGISQATKQDIISKIERLDSVLSPENEKTFLSDLIRKRLGIDITTKEAKKITELSSNIKTTKSKMNTDFSFPSEELRLAYGRSVVDLQDYVKDLKVRTNKFGLAEAKSEPITALKKGIVNIGGLSKSLKASLDNSVIGRQGLKTLFTNPKIWLKNSKKSFEDIVKVFGGENVMREIKADVLSRPNSLNGLYNKERLAVGVIEEAYPTSLPEKIPGLGRAFKASETAFTGFQYRTRADLFDKYVEIAEKTGGDIIGIGKLVNSLTGRGSIGSAEKIATELNNVFFSPRLFKSNLDTLTAHAGSSNMGRFFTTGFSAKKQAAKNTLKIIGGIAAILAIADAVSPGSVEWDARSADFGKIKIGDTRFDVSGGMSSVITLIARNLRSSSKSSITGLISELNTGNYGSRTRLDTLINFSQNKLSPVASTFNRLYEGETFEGKKPTFGSEAKNLFAPLPITNYQELKDDPNSANILLGILADSLGIGTNTYSATEDWSESNSKEMTEFKERVGEDILNQANDEFNQRYNDWLLNMIRDTQWKQIDNDTKGKLISNKKREIKKDILTKY